MSDGIILNPADSGQIVETTELTNGRQLESVRAGTITNGAFNPYSDNNPVPIGGDELVRIRRMLEQIEILWLESLEAFASCCRSVGDPPTVGTQGNAWNNQAVASGGLSAPVDCQYVSVVSVFGNASANTTITVRYSQDNISFYDAFTFNTGVGDFSSTAQIAARYVQLKSSQARTLTATVAGKS